jgi:ornithine cyclodeaminase
MDGGVLTAIRTAAATAVATEKLARTNSRTLAILGCGEEAESHLRAIPEVRELDEVRVWGRNKDKAKKFVDEHGPAVKAKVVVADSVEQAVQGADIVCTVTAASEPILFGRSIEKGIHINLVGSSFPDKAEVDTELVVRSLYFVDYRESALAQACEFLRAKEEGAVDDAHIVAEIGEVLMGEADGRRSDEEITVYKSLGVIAQDLAAATYVWKQAESRGLGTVAQI